MKGRIFRDGEYHEVDLYGRDGMVLRPGTMDEYVQREMPGSYGMLQYDRRRVFDVGANIGAFTRYALKSGAAFVLSVEPELTNFEMLELNTSSLDGVQLRGAVVPDDFPGTEISIYVNQRGRNPGGATTWNTRGRSSFTVPARPFHALIEEHEIDTIKMDCEGSEFQLLREPLPTRVKQFVGEIHLNKSTWRQNAEKLLHEQFSRWECIREPVITNSNWHTLVAYWRD